MGYAHRSYLIGARFGTPSPDKDEMNAMGRGMIELVNSMYTSLRAIQTT